MPDLQTQASATLSLSLQASGQSASDLSGALAALARSTNATLSNQSATLASVAVTLADLQARKADMTALTAASSTTLTSALLVQSSGRREGGLPIMCHVGEQLS